MNSNRNARPLIASVTMGYGHLRAAYPLAEALHGEVIAVDEPPLAQAKEVHLWSWVRRMHEALSKPLPALSALEGISRGLMDTLTMIPSLHEPRDHKSPGWSARVLDKLIRLGLGQGLVEELRRSGAPLLTTFYAPAIVADRAGIEKVYCVVTDADCNRVWAPLDATRTRIHYFAPSRRIVRRLQSFGVPEQNITLTGFPLPPSLTESSGDGVSESARDRLRRRLTRLDPRGTFREAHEEELSEFFSADPQTTEVEPLHLMFAVGGAGAQSEMVDAFLPSLRPMIASGALRIQLVSGTRPEVRAKFLKTLQRCKLERHLGREISIISGDDFASYYHAINQALLHTDILWTKPSELSFYPALGIPCIFAPPVGAHERFNRRWLREQGIGLKPGRPDLAYGWLNEWLEDGTLAAAAWSGFMRLPKHGTQRIVRRVLGKPKLDVVQTPKSAE